MKGRSLAPAVMAIGLAALGPSVAAQQRPDDVDATLAAAAVESADARRGPPATLTYANRAIIQLRGSLLGRAPAERVATARLLLDRIVDTGITGPVESRPLGALRTIHVGGYYIFPIVPSDIDPLAGETLAQAAALATSRLQSTLNEVGELRRPRQLLAGVIQVVLATAGLVVAIWILMRVHAAASQRLARAAEQRLHASAVGDLVLRSSRIIESLNRAVALMAWGVAAVVANSWLTFCLRRFPYTRPWGESLSAFLLGQVALAGTVILAAIPGLFTIVLVAVIARFVTRSVQLFFNAVEARRITIPWIHPEIAQPTRKLITAALWLFALAVAFPYLPGSGSDAFKGVSVFVGLMISLGSSGLVNQMMSGLTLTYSRALHTGDFVKVGDVEGTVVLLGSVSTKLRTEFGEDVTIPNAVVVSQIVTNYSRLAEADGVFVPAEITIGYDTPWRQVQALLLMAAARTPGVRREPAPVVRQTALEDPYVKYVLLFCLERPADRLKTLTAVHANILDAFNEYGVQIMSPRYVIEPDSPKVVPRDRWFSAPASPAADGDAGVTVVGRTAVKEPA